MMNALFASLSRVLRGPVERYVRPNRRLNSIAWDLQYKLGFWRYLDRLSDGEMPLALIETWAPMPAILDLGCGSSANMPLPPGRYRHYHGVDVSRAAIAQARGLARPHTSFSVADIRTFTTPSRFDAILLREVLYYLSPHEQRELLLRLPALLSPRGRIVVQVHDVTRASDVVDLVRGCGVPVDREVPARLGEGPAGAFLVLR
ncbi:class I SAM-dependent methyltransferase [Dactylosporangium salmoneum]|uniref:Methyltransferase domain-containing protein n=1 Tax=Dactylosporangium salmoneum TaxID=53361 RepID=A0ABN3GDE6_9ACTN